MHSLTGQIDYESASFWVALASLALAIGVSAISIYLAQASVRIAQNSLDLTKELAARDLRDWTQRKWFDLYDAAEEFRTLLERFNVKYDRKLATKEFEDDAHELAFVSRRMIRFGGVFPENPTVNALFDCVRKWNLGENLFSKEMAGEYDDAIEGLRQQAQVPIEVLQKL
jgi:hypothetical protein